MTPPSVSLCIPVYAAPPRHLASLLTSIASQTRGDGDVEVVLGDDGGNPTLDQVVARSGLDRVEVVRNPERLGMVANWNAVARRSTAPLVMVLGQDDELERGLVSAYRAAFAATPEAVACSAGETWIDDEGALAVVPRRPNRREHIFTRAPSYVLDQAELVALCLRNGQVYGEPSAVMFRREAFDRAGGYREDMGHIADLDLVLRLAADGPVVYLAEPLVRRRLHPAMATTGQQASGETAAARERLHREWIGHPSLTDRDRARARASLVSWAARDVVKALGRRRWSVAREQASVVRRYGRVPVRWYVENAAELVTGRNRDER